MGQAKVYFTDFRVHGNQNLLTKLDRLLQKAGMAELPLEGKFTAIKIHFGEPGNLAYLRANYAKVVVDALKKTGAKPFLTDCNTLYPGMRRNALDHLEAAYIKRLFAAADRLSRHHCRRVAGHGFCQRSRKRRAVLRAGAAGACGSGRRSDRQPDPL